MSEVISFMNPGLAYNWYIRLLNDYQRKKKVYLLRGFKPPTIASQDWEVFGSILLCDKGKRGNGSDLLNHEIKSAHIGNGFEYQYCRKSCVEKWQKDMAIKHLLISYGDDYLDICARLLSESVAKKLMSGWGAKIEDSYLLPVKKLRCRESITYDQAVKNGVVIFQTQGGNLVHSPHSHNDASFERENLYEGYHSCRRYGNTSSPADQSNQQVPLAGV
jgi:hypothetical protein